MRRFRSTEIGVFRKSSFDLIFVGFSSFDLMFFRISFNESGKRFDGLCREEFRAALFREYLRSFGRFFVVSANFYFVDEFAMRIESRSLDDRFDFEGLPTAARFSATDKNTSLVKRKG
jgi:hypothetical protein